LSSNGISNCAGLNFIQGDLSTYSSTISASKPIKSLRFEPIGKGRLSLNLRQLPNGSFEPSFALGVDWIVLEKCIKSLSLKLLLPRNQSAHTNDRFWEPEKIRLARNEVKSVNRLDWIKNAEVNLEIASPYYRMEVDIDILFAKGENFLVPENIRESENQVSNIRDQVVRPRH